jgi:hypothetical protein
MVRASAHPVAFVISVIASAVALGLVLITATVLALDALRFRERGGDIEAAFYLLVGGTLAGVFLAAAVAWRLLAPLESAYRRGGLSIVSAFATILLMLICIPVDRQFGSTGLGVLLGVSVVAALALLRRARRLGAAVA